MHEITKERSAIFFVTHRMRRLAGGDHFIQPKPLGKKLPADMPEQAALEARLCTDKKRVTLRSKRVLVSVATEKAQPHKCVHNSAQSALGSSGSRDNLSESFRIAIEGIEDTVSHSRFDHKCGGISPRKLQDTFRCNRRRGGAHYRSSPVKT
jgi:hypothetical protein